MAAVLKTAMARKRHRGFESHALRSRRVADRGQPGRRTSTTSRLGEVSVKTRKAFLLASPTPYDVTPSKSPTPFTCRISGKRGVCVPCGAGVDVDVGRR